MARELEVEDTKKTNTIVEKDAEDGQIAQDREVVIVVARTLLVVRGRVKEGVASHTSYPWIQIYQILNDFEKEKICDVTILMYDSNV